MDETIFQFFLHGMGCQFLCVPNIESETTCYPPPDLQGTTEILAANGEGVASGATIGGLSAPQHFRAN